MRHAVIMAGGAGVRLWPLSRRNHPKQLLRLFSGASLLRQSYERVAAMLPPEQINVITNQTHLPMVAEEIPELPAGNLLGEPIGRDTANAIGLAAALLHRRDPGGTMAVFTADHLISPQDKFAAAIEAGLCAAERYSSALITFGVTPDGPKTGYGYIHKGEQLSGGAYEVLEFKEKPSLEVAERYIASGEYLWNSGMFAWGIAAIRAELFRQLPNNAALLDRLAVKWNDASSSQERQKQFESLERISIDFGVMEKAERVLMVEMPCRWRDLGSWTAIAESREPDAKGNVVIAERALVEDGRGNIVVSETDHLIVALGVDDLVIVHSDDATLICRRDQVERVRDLASARIELFGDRFE
ncbi:MAG: mannose-1-phosphate guanylyltransferase [Planctomycetes bacterium]|nr:mannose-1-phosphate guanylyltransferase [Planctomycetota bacterium]